MSHNVVTLDVREDLRQGREPFSKIMQTVAALQVNEELILIAPFQPTPLFGVLAAQGFSYRAQETPAGEWEVTFTRDGGATAPKPTKLPAVPRRAPCGATPVLDVDARGLEPPQPLVKILEALATLPIGAQLRAQTDRRPMHLYTHLEERGFTGETEEQADGHFVTYVYRI
jgi:uncharacterized protein (DUF2249 family)